METLYLDMDNVVLDFPSEIARYDYGGRLDEVPEIFALMDLMPGVPDAFHQIASRFVTYILSIVPWKNPPPLSDMLIWVQSCLGDVAYKRLTQTRHKNLSDQGIIVDDRVKNGNDRFNGEHVHFDTEQFPDWPPTVTYLPSHT